MQTIPPSTDPTIEIEPPRFKFTCARCLQTVPNYYTGSTRYGRDGQIAQARECCECAPPQSMPRAAKVVRL
jgi:hypothetical protein